MISESNNSTSEIINCINFNQTGTCISVGTSTGYDIFNCDPFGKFYSESEPDNGGYSIVEMLFSTSLLALVGNGDSPHLSPRRLRLVNTKKHTIICEMTFPTSILSVKMNKSRLVVLLNLQIYIYDISNMSLLYVIDRESNFGNLISLSPNVENNYLAYPSPSMVINSDIRTNVTTNNANILYNKLSDPLSDDAIDNNIDDDIENDSIIQTTENNNDNFSPIDNGNIETIVQNGDVIIFDLVSLQPTMVIEAHKNGIAALALSPDGLLLATASEKGTIIRIFNVMGGFKLYQFRRGTYSTKIYSMSFSEDNRFLSVCSSSKTVHIFKLGNGSNIGSDSDNDIDNDVDSEMDENSTNSNSNYIDDISVRKPYVDASRKTVGRMIRNSSQSLTRKAAKTLGQIFPIKVTSILEPSRHFASLKIPIDDVDKYLKSSAFIGSTVEINIANYPELFVLDNEDLNNVTNTTNNTKTKTRRDEHGNEINSDNPTLITMLMVRVVTTEGYLYNYVLDPERGGDCLLLTQFSVLRAKDKTR